MNVEIRSGQHLDKNLKVSWPLLTLSNDFCKEDKSLQGALFSNFFTMFI